nr:hypothetical protein [Tanacetum cinerariifolium]
MTILVLLVSILFHSCFVFINSNIIPNKIFDPIDKTPENTDDEGNDEENLGLNIGREEGQDEEDDEDELYRDVNINLEGRVVQLANVHTTQEFEDSHVTLTLAPTTVAPLLLSAPTITPSTITTKSTVPQAPSPPITAPSTLLQDLPNFGSYMDQRMNEAVKVAVQIQSYSLRDEAQAENEEFLKNFDENIQKIIKEQVKEQVKIILDTYEDTVTLKRRRDDDADKDEEPFAGSDRGSKRRREGKEPEESAHDVYSKRRIITVTELKFVKWHNYKHLDWITMCRDDDKLYKFKEGDFKRLRIKDIEDMLLLLVQGKLTNLTKKLNLTRPDTYHSDLKRKEAYIAYSNPRGFIYQNKDKQNRLMRIDELHKLNDEHLSDSQVFIMKMETLLEPTSNKLMVGNVKIDVKVPVSSGLKDS